MIYQTDRRLNPEIRKYGCAFMSLAYYRDRYIGVPWHASQLNMAWETAKDNGVISGDLNLDGDTDDEGECEIVSWTRLCHVLGLPLRNVEGHHPIDSPLAEGCYTVCAWYNPRTRFTHFVVGTERPVQFDPIGGGSVTVREGAPKADGLRIFQRL